MAVNNIFPFASLDNPLFVEPQATYAVDPELPTGNTPGTIANTLLVNKVLRQATSLAAGTAQFLADNQSNDIVDGLTPEQISSYFTSSIQAALAITQPQFDASTAVATDEFVQRALGNSQAATVLTENFLILLGDSAGSVFTLAPASGNGTINLPAISSLIPGCQYTFLVDLGHVSTLNANGSDLIYYQGVPSSSFTLHAGQTATFVCDNRGWEISSNALSTWNANLITNGYLVFPIGAQNFILQWGMQTLSTPNVSYFTSLINFPITFPTMCFLGLGLPQTKVNPSTNTAVISTFNYMPSSMQIGLDSNQGGVLFSIAQQISYIALGF